MARYKITVSTDQMAASIRLTDDGNDPKKNEIISALEEQEISYGIVFEVIDGIIEHPKYDVDIPIAYGKGPKIGENGKLKVISKAKERKEEKNYVNLRELSNIVSVFENEQIAEIVPPTIGESGENVYGKEITGFPGEEVKLNLGENVERNENKILSKSPGELVFKQNPDKSYFLDVSKIYHVDGDVDYSTGNIRFPGTVVIKGSVRPGFIIEAENDVEIKGVIESATVISKGNIFVSGVKGAGKGLIKGKNVNSNYLENANVEADENVIVRQAIINSSIKAGKVIKITSGGGRITGGYLVAGLRIDAPIIGSEINVRTTMEVGLAPEINEEFTVLNSQIMVDLENLKKVSTIIKSIQKLKDEGKLDNEKIELFKKTLTTAKVLKESLEKNEIRINDIKKIIENSEKHGTIAIKNSVYPGSEIIINKIRYYPEKEITSVEFYLSGDKIMVRNYTEFDIGGLK
ncbi:MAG TPA: FapA family protein [Tepiditoga sp.]|nr:DUF342 domain-containing protein [Thermotogota bacterium]HOO74438.1 FapA family protein [Tepiditoga sp.]